MTQEELDAGLLAILPELDTIPAEQKEGMSPFIRNTANVISVVSTYLLINHMADPALIAAVTVVSARATVLIEATDRVETFTPGTLAG